MASMLNASILDIPNCRHGFLTREGGVSIGVYAGLNCGPGSSDDGAAVRENRRRALEQLAVPGAVIVTAYQSHSATVATVEAVPQDNIKADAMVSKTPGLALGILTADCAPVLLVDPEAGVIGALHAGWKGAVAGIVANTVAAMAALGAQAGNVRAAIGPCIAQRSYEVGADLHDAVMGNFAEAGGFFAPSTNKNHWQFDLAGFVTARLNDAGVGRVEDVGCDTYADEARLYSYRRATHRGEVDYGRQISLIALASAGGAP